MTGAEPFGLPADLLARCAALDATIRAMVAADGDPARQRRLHRKACRLEDEIRARLRDRLP